MKCAKCGAELKTGCIYCSVCGQEAQIVSEFNLLEDDFLRELLRDEKSGQPLSKEKGQEAPGKKAAEKKQEAAEQAVPAGNKGGSQKKKNRIPLIVGISGAACLLAGLLVFAAVRHTQNHSFSYQMKQAAKYEEREVYDKAVSHLKRALELDGNSLDTWLELADVYVKQEDMARAIESLKEAVQRDSGNPKPFQKLIEIYEAQKDYESIAALASLTNDSGVLELFEKYLAAPPSFRQKPGDYDQVISLAIDTDSGNTVYYTLDGSDPKENGDTYHAPVELPEGEATVRAVARNKFGLYSEEVSGSYQTKFQPPDMPSVTPEGGIFNSPQTITIRVPRGCKAYYTWDGSDPNAQSQRYEDPMEIPEGNNILSVVAISQHGVCSKVLKCNFIYLP